MCGIGGFVDFERDARRGGPILHGMKRTLTPRGPSLTRSVPASRSFVICAALLRSRRL